MKKLPALTLSLLLSAAGRHTRVQTRVSRHPNCSLPSDSELADDDLKAAQTGAKQYLEAMNKAPHEAEAHKETAKLTEPQR